MVVLVERRAQSQKNGAEFLKEIAIEGKELDFWLPTLGSGICLSAAMWCGEQGKSQEARA